MTKLKDIPQSQKFIDFQIKLDLTTGKFEVNVYGPPISYSLIDKLLDEVKKILKEKTGPDGRIGPKKEEQDKEKPPWLS
jgi:hypothetical protein